MKLEQVKFKDCIGRWAVLNSLLDKDMTDVSNFPDIQPSKENIEEELEKRKNNDTYCIFASDEFLDVGMIVFTDSENHINIHELYVDPAFRSIGVGSSLLFEVEKIRNNRPIVICTVGGNERALKLYQREGFKVNKYVLQKYE